MTVPSTVCIDRHLGLLSPQTTERSSSSTNRDKFMAGIQKRIALGFIVGAISVLTFHQAMWELLHYLALPGLGMPPPFPTEPVPPFGVPRIASLCFWGGVWGAAFGAVWRGPRASLWWAGLLLGVVAALTGMFIVAAIKGQPIGGGWVLTNWIRSLLINGFWGLGVGLMLSALPGATVARRQYGYH
jgi:tetrahydromethanopterin S-methyltransferase subunit B